MFFDRDGAGLPQRWIDRMVVAASSVAEEFSSDRMVSEYLEQCYVPGAFHRRAMMEGDREPLKRLVAWKERVRSAWPGVRFEGVKVEPDPATLPPAAAFDVAGPRAPRPARSFGCFGRALRRARRAGRAASSPARPIAARARRRAKARRASSG